MEALRQPVFHILRSLAAAILGSLIASAALGLLFAGADGGNAGLAFGYLVFAFLIGLWFTIPCALLIAAPVSWLMRGWIARHPLPGALTLGAIGAGAGWFVIWVYIGGGSGYGPAGNPLGGLAPFGAGYGAAIALALAWLIWLSRRSILAAIEEGSGY